MSFFDRRRMLKSMVLAPAVHWLPRFTTPIMSSKPDFDIKEIKVLNLGYPDVDKILGGIWAGEFVVLGGRPSMGKSAFGFNVALNVADQKKSVAYFSIEMSKEQALLRIRSALAESASAVSKNKVYIDDASGITPQYIREKCLSLQKAQGLDFVIIDYIQLMRLGYRVESREIEVSEISRQLKYLAKELHVPILILSQLNRGIEGRANKRPLVSDIRESGTIEEVADSVMLLYRDDYYNRGAEATRGKVELIVAKNRRGPEGAANLHFDQKCGRFAVARS